MDYTNIKHCYINGEDKEFETELLSHWVKFCFKNSPLPQLEASSLNERFKKAVQYFEDHFRGNLCFFEEKRGFVIFGEGEKWLDSPFPIKNNIAVLVMAVGFSSSLAEANISLTFLLEAFRRLKEDMGYSVIAWNQNRTIKKRGFERILKKLGAKNIGDTYYV